MAASNYTAENIMSALCDGVAFPVPAGTWVSAHTGDPGVTGANEVSTAAWPGYLRRQVTSWNPTATGERKNGHQLTFPSHDGLADITLSHWAVWDAASGGHPLNSAALDTARLQKTGDIFVIDTNAITWKQT
jgi:hypothetical protein